MNLDQLQTLEQLEVTLNMPRDLIKKLSKGRQPLIPLTVCSQRLIWGHPRMIFAQMAAKQGVSRQTIAAAFGEGE